MKNQILQMLKTSKWKWIFCFTLGFSTFYNLVLTDYPYTSMTFLLNVLGASIGATIGYFLEKRFSLSAKIDKLLEKYPQVRSTTFQFISIVGLILISVMVYNVAFTDAQTSDTIHSFAHVTWQFGSMLMIMLSLIHFFISSFKTADFFNPFKILFKRLIALAIIVGIVRFVGDDFIQTMHSDPMLIVQGLCMLICILLAYSSVNGRPQVVEQYQVQGSGHVALASPHPILTDRDEEHIRTHEAGHTLIHAMLLELPDNLLASIKQKTDGSLGRVLTSDGVDHLKTKEALEWIMFRSIAGQIAEEVVHNTPTSGCAVDLNKWECNARRYLANGFGGFYYQSPASELEVKANSTLLQDLREQQSEIVKLFLTQNIDLLSELATELGHKEVMDKTDLKPFLERAQLGNLKKVKLTFAPESINLT